MTNERITKIKAALEAITALGVSATELVAYQTILDLQDSEEFQTGVMTTAELIEAQCSADLDDARDFICDYYDDACELAELLDDQN